VKVLVIGGERHGEWIEVFDGTRIWCDLARAVNHVIRKLTWNVQSLKGEVTEAYVIYVAVHEQLQGPDEPAVVGELLRALTMNEFARAHGEAQEIPKEPAGASLTLPRDGAA
jgi:hypothetical protein